MNKNRIKWHNFINTKDFKKIQHYLSKMGQKLVIKFDNSNPPQAEDVFVKEITKD